MPLHKVKEGEGEAGPLSGEPGPLAGDTEVLAREAAGPEGCTSSVTDPDSGRSIDARADNVTLIEGNDISEVRDSGPSLGEDGTGVGVDLGEADGAPSSTFKPKVKPSDS